MKAFLLAAGHGTRLRPITDTVPKCLVSIRGTPMLSIWLNLCAQNGIDEVLINIHSHAEQVRDFLAKQGASGVNVRITEEKDLLGSAGTIAANRDWVAGEECFWILFADVLTNANLSRLLSFHRARRQLATLGLYRVAEPRRCGIATLDSNAIITAFTEKPEMPESNLAFSGLMVASPVILDLIPTKTPSDLGFDLLPRLVGQMAGCLVDGYLTDIGTMDTYTTAQRLWPGIAN